MNLYVRNYTSSAHLPSLKREPFATAKTPPTPCTPPIPPLPPTLTTFTTPTAPITLATPTNFKHVFRRLSSVTSFPFRVIVVIGVALFVRVHVCARVGVCTRVCVCAQVFVCAHGQAVMLI